MAKDGSRVLSWRERRGEADYPDGSFDAIRL